MDTELHIREIESNLVPFASGHLILPDGPERYTVAQRMAEMKVPGLSVAVIEDGEIAWARGYGLLNATQDRKVTTASLFQACSISKMITAAIVLRLVELGALDLDVDVNTYLTSWQLPENAFTRERSVTLRLLLTHTAGINRPDSGFEWEEGTVPTTAQILSGQAPAEMDAAYVEMLPGSQWQYSNFGYVIIQAILEDVIGRPLPRIAQDIVFGPLSMANSTFDYPLEEAWAAREIMLHDRDGNPTYPGIIPSAVAHGGLMTTPSDLARFGIDLMAAYRGGHDRLLVPETVRRMFRQDRWVEDLGPFGFAFGQGLGVFLTGEGDRRIVFHPGGNDPGAASLLCLLPELNKGAAIMANGAKGLFLSVELLTAIARSYGWE